MIYLSVEEGVELVTGGLEKLNIPFNKVDERFLVSLDSTSLHLKNVLSEVVKSPEKNITVHVWERNRRHPEYVGFFNL